MPTSRSTSGWRSSDRNNEPTRARGTSAWRRQGLASEVDGVGRVCHDVDSCSCVSSTGRPDRWPHLPGAATRHRRTGPGGGVFLPGDYRQAEHRNNEGEKPCTPHCGSPPAFVALVGGISKTFVPKAELAAQPGGEWTAQAPVGFVKGLGILELLAAMGMTLPDLLDIGTVMVPVTALCWIALMIGAMITHGRRGQTQFVAVNSVYLALAAFVAWGRLGAEQFGG